MGLFDTGKSVAEIAKERGLVESTIEGHLRFFVEQGKLAVDKILSTEKQQAISREIAAEEEHSMGAVKKRLGDEFSYGEIKMMLAHQKYLDSK